MKRPVRLWFAIIAFSFVLGFLFWMQWGYENPTITLYEETEEPEESGELIMAPQAAPAEERAAAPATENPTWVPVVRWGSIIIASCLAIYVVYLELIYRRRSGSYW